MNESFHRNHLCFVNQNFHNIDLCKLEVPSHLPVYIRFPILTTSISMILSFHHFLLCKSEFFITFTSDSEWGGGSSSQVLSIQKRRGGGGGWQWKQFKPCRTKGGGKKCFEAVLMQNT